jgi:hypothetical protein
MTPERLTSTPFPPYAYRPGRHPHPIRSPAGHMFGKERPPSSFDPARWRESKEYLYGIDLFNAQYFWEAHEAWEGLWHALGRRGPLAAVLEGLIQIAAAHIKAEEGRMTGVTILSQKAFGRFESSMTELGGGSCVMGVDLLDFRERSARWFDAYIHVGREPIDVAFPFVVVDRA